MLNQALPLLPLLALVGCAVGPNYQTPEIAVPELWPEHSMLTAEHQEDWSEWWRQFADPVLDELVVRALDRNLEVRLQAARVEEARARLGLARADRFPTVEAQANASRERIPAASVPAGNGTTTNLFSVSGMLGYELDLWGRLAREREAAEALLNQNVFARDAVQLNVVADVVTTYFDLRAARIQLAITEETIESRRETLRLQETRFSGGDIDEFTIHQARSEWEAARADLPLRVQRTQMLEGALGVLVGLEPAELMTALDLATADLPALQLPEHVPAYLPAELLERRPDIRAAEAGLMAATARIGVAQAQRLPRINLTALIGTVATSGGDLFTASSEMWNLGGNVGAPIWDFGRGRARTETAEAVAAQAAAQYRMTVNLAFNEVRNALILYETSGERVGSNRRLVASLERTEELAQIRYREGYIGFMELLDAQRALLSSRLALEEAMRDHLTSTATLFKALGGGWRDV